jgi:hypothetical protein
MIFFSLFNEKIFKYLFIAIALDYLSSHSLTILIGIRKPFDFYRDFPMQYKGSSDLYFYCFISPILSLFINSGEMFVGKEKLIGAIYCNITNIALAITMSLGIFDIKQWKVKKR